MEIKVIKTDAQYEAAQARLDELLDAEPGTPEWDELDLLSLVIEDYEEKHYPIPMPDPIEAIKFRMDQMGLIQKDLMPFIGSQSKISEVLNGKRSLSLSMIRSLHSGLGIPADVLLREPDAEVPDEINSIEWHSFPLPELIRRGWFPDFFGQAHRARDYAEELLRDLFNQAGGMQPALARQSQRQGSALCPYSQLAWQACVLVQAKKLDLPDYEPNSISQDDLRALVRMFSPLPKGPALAAETLQARGIAVVFERHFPKTQLDGAAMLTDDRRPVIALTLRHDRVDNFWFTLIHELEHLVLHIDTGRHRIFMDSFEQNIVDEFEEEANKEAGDVLIEAGAWRRFDSGRKPTVAKLQAFAKAQSIHPAIVAGRYRKEHGYRHFASLVKKAKVKHFFPQLTETPMQEED